MRKLFAPMLTLALLLASAALASAQSAGAAGDWDVILNTPGGPRNFKATFKVDGEKLSGTLKGERGELPIQGTARGKEVKFSYTIKYQEQDLTITLTGNLDGDAIKGTADFGGFAQDEWSAKRSTEGAAVAADRAPTGTAALGDKLDISGAWTFEVETAQGSGSPSFTFKQEGEKLTGQYKGLFGEAPLTGTVKGNEIQFSIKVNAQGQDLTLTYTGTIEKNGMKGKAQLGDLGSGTWTAKRQ